jgi:hypothetical protein
MTTIRATFAERVQEFCRTTGMSPREFGIRAVGDSHFWRRLTGIEGRMGVTLGRLERAERYMAEYQVVRQEG